MPEGFNESGKEEMSLGMSRALRAVTAALLLATGSAMAQRAAAQGTAPADMVLLNGKIVTVDDRFSIARAVAIGGERIVYVGTTEEARRRAGPKTRVIDLHGRTVIPGLIDNHAHFMRAAEYWDREVRWDGVTSRRKALEMLRAKVLTSKPGEWILVLGGWSHEQFADDQRPFTLKELDQIAPDNPVLLQLIDFRIYTNSKGLETLGIDENTPVPPGAQFARDAEGRLNGTLEGAAAVRFALDKLPPVTAEHAVAEAQTLLADLNRMGITAFIDYGGRGSDEPYFVPFRTLADEHKLTARVFHAYGLQPESPQDVDGVIAKIREMKPFQGDDWYDQIGYGETVYPPLDDNLLAAEASPTPEQLHEWRRIAEAVAGRGMHLDVHAQLRGTLDAFLAEIEAVNAVTPVKGLRWTISHADQIEPKDIDRMRRLGLSVQLHGRPTIQGLLMRRVHGVRALDMPPLRMVQASGLPWGLGSDATVAAPSNPFLTLGWAVTGKMVGGQKVLDQTITREQALIAHTRSNAYFLFEEANLGSIAEGRYADLLVLDRDYLTVPADEIKDIKPLLTMVGGRVMYAARGFR